MFAIRPESRSPADALRAAIGALALGAVFATAPTEGHATIAPASSGDGELFLVIQDSTAQISYTFDTGVTMQSFLVSAQQDTGIQYFWAIDPAADAALQSFLALTNVANYVWAVLAADSAGPVSGNGQRLLTTARQGQEGLIASSTNPNLRSGISTPFAAYLNGVNITGTHGVNGTLPDTTVNGSSVNAITDPNFSYFGEPGGTGPRLQGNALPFSNTNPVGTSSWFYVLGSAAANGPVSVDEFDNLSHDGYFGFTFVDPNQNPTSPYAGTWLLSYTLPPALLQGLAVTPAGRERAALTEYLAGSLVRTIAAPANEFSGYTMPVVAAVPEPGAFWLLGIGALGVAARRRAARRPDQTAR
jgi:hypothetical protein